MQTTSPQFETIARDTNTRPLSYSGRIAWEKEFDPSITFFVLNQSVLDGTDILAPSDDNPIQEFDYYLYTNVDDRMQSLEVSRELDFPFSVASAIADFSLENHDDYYTPGSGSDVADFVIPSRPLRLLMGFNGENLQQFVGLTEGMPEINDDTKSVSFHAMDWFGKLFTLKTPQVLAMQNVRTDEVLEVLFEQAGLSPTQYTLAKGRNVIKFLTYDKNTNMGTIIRQLMQAEMGQLFMDEQGMIRFLPRLERDQTPDYTFDDENIIDIKTVNNQNIINVVEINAEVRAVQVKQPMFTVSDSFGDDYIVPAGESKDIFVNLSDPAISATEPTAGVISDDSFFVALDLSGGATSGVTITDTFLFTNSYRITFHNANGYDVRINDITLWGEPARVVDEINYVRKDEDSIDKYEENVLSITNNFIQDVSSCDSFALTILDSYAEYSGDIQMTVRGTPALQMGDLIQVTKDTFTGDYRTTKMINKMVGAQFEQIVTARRYIPKSWFILDESVLNGTDVLAP